MTPAGSIILKQNAGNRSIEGLWRRDYGFSDIGKNESYTGNDQ